MISREPRDPVPSTHPAPMSCSEAQLWMSVAVDGEVVPTDTGVRLEAHLARCEPCRRWRREEAERSSRLRDYLRAEPSARRDFERTLIEAATEAGWDGRTLRRRHGLERFFLGPDLKPRPLPLILLAAAALFLAVVGLGRLDWLQPSRELASRPSEGTVSVSAPPLGSLVSSGGADERAEGDHGREGATATDGEPRIVLEGENAPGVPVGSHVLPDADGRPVEVQFTRSLYRYRILPPNGERGNGPGGEGADLKRDSGSRTGRGDDHRSVYLELERVGARSVRLTSWPYQ